MKTPTRQADRHVEAVLAAVDVLECFLSKPVCTTLDLMQATGFTRNRVVRLTGTLVHKGLLMMDGQTGLFSTGPKLSALGKVFERNQGILLMVRPVLRQISLKTGESASFYVRDGLERVVLAREEGTQAIRHTIAEGQRMDLHAGAAGKVILAYSSKDVLEAVAARTGLPKHTPQTITDKDRLAAELEKVRKQGVAVSVGERAADACAIAAPVFDQGRDLVGALTIAGPTSRFTTGVRRTYADLLTAAAERLSRRLGWNEKEGELQHGT
jgi:DNA-binding IclR family transcriptional regulator